MVASTVSPCSRRSWSTSSSTSCWWPMSSALVGSSSSSSGRALGQRPGQEDPLPLAAGEGGQLPAGERGQVEPVEHLVARRPGRRRTPGPAAGCTGCGRAARSRAPTCRPAPPGTGRRWRPPGPGRGGAAAAIGVPKRETAPGAGSRPPTARSRVDLPAPFGPITVTHSPAATVRSTPAQDRRAAQRDVQVPHLDARADAVAVIGSRDTRRAVRSTRTKNGAAEKRGDHADRHLGRGGGGPGDQVGQGQEGRRRRASTAAGSPGSSTRRAAGRCAAR